MKIDVLEPIRYRLITTPTAPAPPIALGSLIYNAASNVFQFWNGAAWVVLGPPANVGAGLPATPSLGQVAFNTTSGQLSFWNGAAWVNMAPPSPTVAPLPTFGNVPFNAGDFSAPAGMTWTVDPADVQSFQFWDFGPGTKMMMVSLYIATSTIGAPLTNELNVKIPNGRLPAVTSQGLGAVVFQGPAGTPGDPATVILNPGLNQFRVFKVTTANYIASVNQTSVSFQVFFQYQ